MLGQDLFVVLKAVGPPQNKKILIRSRLKKLIPINSYSLHLLNNSMFKCSKLEFFCAEIIPDPIFSVKIVTMSRLYIYC